VHLKLLPLRDGLGVVAVEGSNVIQKPWRTAKAPSFAGAFVADEIITVCALVASPIMRTYTGAAAYITILTSLIMLAKRSAVAIPTLSTNFIMFAGTGPLAFNANLAPSAMSAEINIAANTTCIASPIVITDTGATATAASVLIPIMLAFLADAHCKLGQ